MFLGDTLWKYVECLFFIWKSHHLYGTRLIPRGFESLHQGLAWIRLPSLPLQHLVLPCRSPASRLTRCQPSGRSAWARSPQASPLSQASGCRWTQDFSLGLRRSPKETSLGSPRTSGCRTSPPYWWWSVGRRKRRGGPPCGRPWVWQPNRGSSCHVTSDRSAARLLSFTFYYCQVLLSWSFWTLLPAPFPLLRH